MSVIQVSEDSVPPPSGMIVNSRGETCVGVHRWIQEYITDVQE